MAASQTRVRWMEPDAEEPAPAEIRRAEIEDVPGRALRVGDQLQWAGGTHIIRAIKPEVNGVLWLTTARVGLGLVREDVPVPIDPARTYPRIMRAVGAVTTSHREERAEHLQPAQRFEHAGQVLQAETVFVSHGVPTAANPRAPVEIFARPVAGGDMCRLCVPADQVMQVVR